MALGDYLSPSFLLEMLWSGSIILLAGTREADTCLVPHVRASLVCMLARLPALGLQKAKHVKVLCESSFALRWGLTCSHRPVSVPDPGWHLLVESSLFLQPRPNPLRSACWLCPSYTSSHIRVFGSGPWVSFLVGCWPRPLSELPECFLATVMVGPSVTFLTGLKGLNDSDLPLYSLLAPQRQYSQVLTNRACWVHPLQPNPLTYQKGEPAALETPNGVWLGPSCGLRAFNISLWIGQLKWSQP